MYDFFGEFKQYFCRGLYGFSRNCSFHPICSHLIDSLRQIHTDFLTRWRRENKMVISWDDLMSPNLGLWDQLLTIVRVVVLPYNSHYFIFLCKNYEIMYYYKTSQPIICIVCYIVSRWHSNAWDRLLDYTNILYFIIPPFNSTRVLFF